MKLRLSLAQVASTGDPNENLATIGKYVAMAAAEGTQLVVFPEAMMRCFGAGPLAQVAQPLDGQWANAVRSIADEHGITVAVGMFTPAADGRVLNTLLVTGNGVEAHYDKIHLFDAFGFAESDTVMAGTNTLVTTIAGIRVGFATCYDVRFPALFHKLSDDGAQVHVVSASWGDGPGKIDHWRLLTRARALDSTAFVAACDQPQPLEEPDGAPRGVGHSLVASPDGQILAELGPEPGLLTIDIDTDDVDAARRAIPVLANRKI